MSIDYRKIENMEQFNELVDDFVETRKALKQKVKEDRGETIATLQVGDKPLTKLEQKYAPIVKSIEKLGLDLKKTHSNWSLFEKFANAPDKKTSEVMARRERGKPIYKIGVNGVVNVEDVQDDIFRVVNPKTGKSIVKQLTPSLSQLLFVPSGNIDFDKISNDAFVNYYEIMKFSKINPKSNKNKKIKIAKKAYDKIYSKKLSLEEKKPAVIYESEPSEPSEDEDDDIETPKLSPKRKVRKKLSNQFSTPKQLSESAKYLSPQFISERKKRRERRFKQREKLLEKQMRKKSGKGLMTVDDMVNRLYLMTQSQHAGNLSSSMQDEMMQIMDVLLKKKIISRKQHKMLFKKYINY